MSFGSLLSHRGVLKRLVETDVDGAPVYDWVSVKTGVRCFVDLSFMRRGKDPGWSPEAGRVADRTGVLFCKPDLPIKPGDRIVVKTKAGREIGTFSVEGALDHVPGRHGEIHHIEVGVSEVATALGRM